MARPRPRGGGGERERGQSPSRDRGEHGVRGDRHEEGGRPEDEERRCAPGSSFGAKCANRYQHCGCGARRQDGHHHPCGEVATEPDPDQAHEEQQRARWVAGHMRCPVVRMGHRDPLDEPSEQGVHVGHPTRGPEVLVVVVEHPRDAVGAVHEREREQPRQPHDVGDQEQAAPGQPGGPVGGVPPREQRQDESGHRARPEKSWVPPGVQRRHREMRVPAGMHLPTGGERNDDGGSDEQERDTEPDPRCSAHRDRMAGLQRHRHGREPRSGRPLQSRLRP